MAESDSHTLLTKETFKAILENPTSLHAFTVFLKKESSQENLNFYMAVEKFKAAEKIESRQAGKIYSTYIHEGSEFQVNLNSEERNNVIHTLKKPTREMFDEAQDTAFNLMFDDSYRRFIHLILRRKAQLQLALKSEDEEEFVGLGDCFCLTDPSLPDNPIVGASEGFVKVTGYLRQDIIPKNCRFLQGDKTDREVVKRMAKNIKEEKEVTELLLNYKKDGTPFWNLLYICPLLDSTGKTKFFLGGQVDVTKNMNNGSPLKSVLEVIETMQTKGTTGSKSASKEKKFSSFFKIFRRRAASTSRGAEVSTVNPSLGIEEQKDLFLETYSNFLIFDAQTNPGQIVFPSSKFTEQTGFSTESIIGKDSSFLKGPLTSHKAIKELKAAIKNGNTFSETITSYDANGEPNANRLFLTPILDGDNKPLYFIAVMKWSTLTEEEIKQLKSKESSEEEDFDCIFQ